MSLKQTIESVTEFIKMFIERVLFFPMYASSEQVHKSRYLSMLMTKTMEFVSKIQYQTLADMQEHAKRREIELENQRKENRQTQASSQPTTKKFRHDESSFGGQRYPLCNRCEKPHGLACCALICFNCSKGHYNRDYKQEAWGVRIYFHCN